tara:strand:- start:841 stop:1473 length:633 start_codon:yes stop_codon:yes gene_type:complete
MNFVKKLKNIVNDIIPNEIKNNDFVKGALLAAGAYYGYSAAPQSFKDLFKPGPTSLVSRGKGFLFGTPETTMMTSTGKMRIKLATEGKIGSGGKPSKLFDIGKKGYDIFKKRGSEEISDTKRKSQALVPTIQTVNVNPNINTGGINKYSSGKVGMVGMTDARVEMALAQLVNSKNFLQAMNGNIPMDFIQPGSASGPTVNIGSTGGTDIT